NPVCDRSRTPSTCSCPSTHAGSFSDTGLRLAYRRSRNCWIGCFLFGTGGLLVGDMHRRSEQIVSKRCRACDSAQLLDLGRIARQSTAAMTAPLELFNSLTRQLETFTPIHPGEARVYSCGPTVYNYPHIGNMRAYVFADVLGRTLSWKGYKLTHVINITDVGHLTDDADAGEDKLEKAAAEKAQSSWDIARHYTEAYWADVAALNIRQPAQWSVATDYIEPMIEFAKSIADKHCYEIDGGLYFDVSTIADYGRLARAQTDEGESRIDPVEGKRNAADFAIWRKTPRGETRQMEWDSPWGRGAPGWHLECSVMSGPLAGFPS